MLIQHRLDGTLRIFTQHDHGQLSGELAHAWRGPGAPLSMACVLAVAMHDLGWAEADAFGERDADQIAFDEEAGLPHDFLTMSIEDKLPIYAQGVELSAKMHAWAGLLQSHHYAAFLPRDKAPSFVDREADRREHLAADLGLEGPEDEEVLRDYERLKFFDLISLFVCMAAPGADPERCPGWISSTMEIEGHSYEFDWDGDELRMSPWPFEAPVDLTLPYRRLERARFADAADFRLAWQEAPELPQVARLCPA